MRELPAGLRAYSQEIDIMLSWLDAGPMDQNAFDRMVAATSWPVTFHEPESFILHWSNPHLDLLQHLIRVGYVVRDVAPNGLVWYAKP